MKTSYIKNATVLVIDDNPTNLAVLCNYLNNMGAEVLVKKEGESGIEIAIRKQPDIIILDILMPNIDGYETCRRLKAEPATQAIPVIFASALVETVDKLKGFEVGGVDYITKPFQVEEVLARIETHLSIIRLQQQLQRANQFLEIANKSLEIVNQKLYKQTVLDGLTQIANRRHFDEYLMHEWQRAVRDKNSIALLLCDIDFFKQYNDTYGHQGGDDCLKQIAQAIEKVSKRPADLVARYGGEEFGVILPNTTISGAIEISEQICQAVRDLKIEHKKSRAANYVTLSLGISCLIPTTENKMTEFIEMADKALYQAKHQGRNRVCVFNNE
jgi:diguanylate cyclase (GGDEF)-like protein